MNAEFAKNAENLSEILLGDLGGLGVRLRVVDAVIQCRSVLDHLVVWKAIQPALSRFSRRNHGMTARPRVLRRVAVRRTVAAQRDAALLTRPQMDPARTGFHAFGALTPLGVFHGGNALQM